MTGAKVHTIDRATNGVLAAWLTVIGRVPVESARLLVIESMRDFEGLPIVDCTPCLDLPHPPAPMTVTAAFSHVRHNPGRPHLLELSPRAVRVIP